MEPEIYYHFIIVLVLLLVSVLFFIFLSFCKIKKKYKDIEIKFNDSEIKIENSYKKYQSYFNKYRELKNDFDRTCRKNQLLIEENVRFGKNIKNLNQELIDLKEKYIKNSDIKGLDDKIIKNFILKEDSLKEEIRELKREINDFYKNDILETKEYKALYKENFNLKNQVESLKSYMKDLEKKMDKNIQDQADSRLYRIIDEQRFRIVELEKVVSILKSK
jgi:peptidoglycan hydrolase CwlO-like protein